MPIITSAPGYPVIDFNPSHIKILQNVRPKEVIPASIFTVITATFGYRYAGKLGIALFGLCGLAGTFQFCWMASAFRLMGYKENTIEYEKYKHNLRIAPTEHIAAGDALAITPTLTLGPTTEKPLP